MNGRSEETVARVLGVLLLVCTVVASLPGALLVIRVVRDGGRSWWPLVFAAMWNLWLWGAPVAAVLLEWRDNVLNDRGPAERLWRVYWRVQMVTLVPALILTGAAYGLVWLSLR